MTRTNSADSLTDLAARRAAGQQHAADRAAHAEQRAARAVAGRIRRPNAELQAILEAGSKELTGSRGAEASAGEVCTWAAEQFDDLLTVACSMADTVLPHVVAQQAPLGGRALPRDWISLRRNHRNTRCSRSGAAHHHRRCTARADSS